MKGTLRVMPEKLIASAGSFASSAKNIKHITDEMLNIVKSLNAVWQGNLSALYTQKFYALDTDMQQIYQKIAEHSKDLQEMAETYQKAEDYNTALSNALPTEILTAAASGGSGGGSSKDTGQTIDKDKGKFEGEGSLLSGGIHGGIGGISGTLSGNLFGYSYSVKKGLESKTKVDENGKTSFDSLGIQYGAEGEVHVAQGTAEWRAGPGAGSATITVGKISGKGAVGVTLFKDGKLAPQISANAEAKATVLEGKVTNSTGTENNNIHSSASGEFLTAKAEANASAGVITYEDDQGNVKKGIGVQGEVGGEAYVATGKVKGGFKIFGIDVDVGLSGHVGGGSAKAGGRVTTGGVGGSIDLGLGVGVGLEFSIDWSNFKFGW